MKTDENVLEFIQWSKLVNRTFRDADPQGGTETARLALRHILHNAQDYEAILSPDSLIGCTSEAQHV